MSATRTCYAHHLGNCHGGITGEHYLSESILEILNETRQLTVRGYPFLQGAEECLPPAALKAKVLCAHHNSALSPLDDVAVRLFRWMHSIERGTWTRDRLVIDGPRLELWMLKLYAGLLASGQGAAADGMPLPAAVPVDLVDVLFGRSCLPEQAGLHFALTEGEMHRRVGTGVTFRPWSNLALQPAAIDIDINGLRFVCRFDPNFDVSTRHHRPAEIRIKASAWAKPKRLQLEWPGHRGATISIDASWRRMDPPPSS